MNIKKVLSYSSAVLTACLMSATATAIPDGDGPCSVREESSLGAVFFVPSGGSGNYGILGWGNGTGGRVSSYDGMLEAAASQCVVVAAARYVWRGVRHPRHVRSPAGFEVVRQAVVWGDGAVVRETVAHADVLAESNRRAGAWGARAPWAPRVR